MKKYPKKFVDSSFMKNATTIDDIRNHIGYELFTTTNKVFGKLLYSQTGMYVDLGAFHLVLHGSSAYLSSFDTANLIGIDGDFVLKGSLFDHVHVLKSPIKYIGRDMFAKVLTVCKEKNIAQLKITPLQVNNSSVFYTKMISHFSDSISSCSIDATGDIICDLK